MQWWCSAQGVPWEWTWQAYPGVWIFIALLALTYRRMVRRVGGAGRREIGFFAAGLLFWWIALDWPVGTLGAGYLASVHMVQYLLLALIAPPLLLNGVPEAAFRRLAERPRLVGVLRIVTHPLASLAIFTTVLITTHLPFVVDRLMVSQLGSFAIDMLWVTAGTIFWWPIVSPVPERPWFTAPVKIGYLIASTILNTAPFAFLAYARFPVYAIYELAPPIQGITTKGDQQLAGFLMKVGGGIIMWTAITLIFLRWSSKEDRIAIGAAPADR